MAATATSSLPAMPPPAGLTPNFENPPSQAYIVYIVMSLCLALVTLLVAVRIYTRIRIAKPLWWDDLASLLAWIFFLGLIGVTFGAVRCGGGVDIWNVSKPRYAKFNKYWKNIMIVARIDITFAKLAILLLFLRLFVPHTIGSKQMWFWIWFMIFFNIIYCIVLILLIQLQCVRRKDPPPNGNCLDQHLLIVTASLINVITEVAILIVPVFAVWGLRMPLTRKLAIVALLSFGSAGIAFSMARLIWQAVTTNNNPTIYNMTVIMLATAETTVAIMAGCLPLLSSFYKFHIEHHVSHISASLNLSRPSERKQKPPKHRHPLTISTTELVSTDVALEEIRTEQVSTS